MGTLRPQEQEALTPRMCQIWGSKSVLPHPKVYASIHCMMLVCGGLVRRKESGGDQRLAALQPLHRVAAFSQALLCTTDVQTLSTWSTGRSWPTQPYFLLTSSDPLTLFLPPPSSHFSISVTFCPLAHDISPVVATAWGERTGTLGSSSSSNLGSITHLTAVWLWVSALHHSAHRSHPL